MVNGKQESGAVELKGLERSSGGAPLLSFQVITDTHVREDRAHTYNRHLELALRDIARNGESSVGIMHVGDLTDHGFPSEYEEMARIWRMFEDKLPPLYATMGNHDVGLGVWEDRLRRFLKFSGMEASYHEHWIEDFQFLFLGTEENHELYAVLSDKQLEWLDLKLAEGASSGNRPAFLFLHQPLKNTVAGSSEEQEWHGVQEDDELRAVLAKHPHAILFTGHTHWELGSENTQYSGNGIMPNMFNASSVAYLWSDEGEAIEGSQGFYVEVYGDSVHVRGRDFVRGAWLENAHFEVKYELK